MPDLIPWGTLKLSKLKGDMDKLVDALCEDFGLGQGACREAVLRVIEADGEWVVACPLPGVSPEDVAVTVEGRGLSITATKRNDQGSRMIELSRSLVLPFLIGQASAELANGVLTVRLSRQAQQSRAIPVAADLKKLTYEGSK